MSLDQRILAVLGEQGTMGIPALANALGDPDQHTLRMRVGYLVSRGRCRWSGDDLQLHDGPPPPPILRKSKKPKEPPPPIVPAVIEIALWHTGEISLIRGPENFLLNVEEARALRDFLSYRQEVAVSA